MNKLFTAVAATALSVGAAQAATLTLDSLPGGYFGSTVAVVNEATITSLGSNLFFDGADGRDGSFCAISGSSCEADMEIDFTNVVENLSFSTGGWDSGDFVALSVYGIGDALLGAVNITANGLVDLTSFGAITRLFFDDSSTGAGFGYGEFSFDEISAVPLPASLPFLLVGLGALGLTRKRKKA